MNVELIQNKRTERIEALCLRANTFEEERILGELAKILLHGGRLNTETTEGNEMHSVFKPQDLH